MAGRQALDLAIVVRIHGGATLTTNQEKVMIFEYVAVENKKVKDKWTETIVAEGKVIAGTRDQALLKVGVLLGAKLTDEVQVTVRPF